MDWSPNTGVFFIAFFRFLSLFHLCIWFSDLYNRYPVIIHVPASHKKNGKGGWWDFQRGGDMDINQMAPVLALKEVTGRDCGNLWIEPTREISKTR